MEVAFSAYVLHLRADAGIPKPHQHQTPSHSLQPHDKRRQKCGRAGTNAYAHSDTYTHTHTHFPATSLTLFGASDSC
jgi:hypothetical protein